jgi:hypothetical protein
MIYTYKMRDWIDKWYHLIMLVAMLVELLFLYAIWQQERVVHQLQPQSQHCLAFSLDSQMWVDAPCGN